MPDVGVLQLEIRDNSTEAGQGLNQLAKALSAVQSAVGNGLNLTGITAPLNRFAKSINEHGSGKTLQSVGSFLKALSDYRKAFSDANNVKFDAEPISQLKAAIGDGIKLGQAGTQIKNIREALEGEWNVDNAYKAGQALAAIGEGAKSIPGGLDKKADQIKKVAEALREYTSASQEAKNVLVGQSAQMNALEDSARKQREWFDQGGFSTGKRMPLNLQFFAEKPDVSGLEEVKSSVQNITEGFKEYKASVEEAKASSSNLDVSGSLSKTEDAMSSISSSIRDFIDLTKIPASGLVGPFKTAGEEVEHITKQIDEQKLSLAQWEQVFEKTQKAIKYNGVTQERTNMLGHAEEGFYSAYEKLNDYDRLLNQVLENASKYSKTAVKPIEGVTEAVSHAMEKVEGYGTGGIRELYASTNELGSALRGELGQAERIKAIAKVAEGTGLSKGEINKQLVECRENADKARQSIESLVDTLNKPVGKLNWATSVDRMLGIGAGIKSASESAQVFSGLDGAVNENATAVSNLSAKYHELKDSIVDSFKSAGGLSGLWKNFGNGIKSMFPTLTGMVKRLGAIAKYRFLRTVIKHITSGFSEGLKNVYEYSKAIGGTFAPAMDSAASAIATMKNSLGAALAPAIQALIPYVNQLVNWFINLVNYANQFFALLAGQSTWTRALPATVNAFDKQKKAAKGAGNAIKDLLADWDELNIIQKESGSGGAGSTTAAEDYLKMFEEVGKFDNKIKDTVKFIQDNMNDVTDIIKDAGIALLGWKFSKAFTGPIAAVGALIAAGKIMEITWKLTGLFDNEFIKTGNDGWIVADAMTNMFGAFLAGTALETVLGGGTGVIMAGVTLVVSGGISYGIALANAQSDKADVLRDLAFIKTGIGFAATSVGFGLATGSAVAGISLAAAFGVPMFVLSAAVTTVVQQIKTAKQIAKDAFTGKHYGAISVQELYDELNDEFKKQSQGYNIVIDAFAEVPDLRIKLSDAADSIAMFTAVINGDGKLTQEEANEFKQAWTTVFSAMTDISSATFTTVFDALNISLTSENEEIRKQAKELRISLLMVKKNISEGMAEAEAEMQDLAGKIANSNATQEEIEKYQKYIEALAKYTNTSFDEFNETIQKGAHIDFENMDEVNEYIQNVKSSYQSIADEIDTGVNTAVDALNEAKREAQFLYDSDQIGDEEYKAAMAYFKQIEDNIREAAEERKSSMQTSIQDAYSLLLSSALQNLHDIPLDKNGNHDYISAIAYIYDYIEPIVKAIVDAGGKVDEELARALQLGVDPGEEVNKVVQGLLEDNQLNLTIADYIRKFYGDAEPEQGPSTDPLDQFIQKIGDFERQYGEALKGLDNTTAEYAKRVKQNLDIIGQNTYGDDYTPDVPINTENPIEVPVQITIEPIMDSNELYQQIRDKILNSDMPETSVPLGQTFDLWQEDDLETLQELKKRIDQFGIGQAFDMLTNYLHGDDWTLGRTNKPNMMASVPTYVPQTNGAFLNGSETVKTEAADPAQEASNVETGVRRGNSDLVGLIRDLIDVTRASNNRPISVTVSPSSGWGFHNAASGAAAAAVTGSETWG